MEFSLVNETIGSKFRLPVNPPNFTIQTGSLNQTVIVANIGELNLWGPEKAATITLQSFFPAQVYPFCTYTNFPKPADCVKLVDSWRVSGKAIRLLISFSNPQLMFSTSTDNRYDFNEEMLIESFEYGMKDGSGDIYFTVVLKRYRRAEVKRIQAATVTSAPPMQRSTPPAPPAGNTYTVQQDDTLWDIAYRFYGDGSRYMDIYNANTSILSDPSLIYVGQSLIIP